MMYLLRTARNVCVGVVFGLALLASGHVSACDEPTTTTTTTTTSTTTTTPATTTTSTPATTAPTTTTTQPGSTTTTSAPTTTAVEQAPTTTDVQQAPTTTVVQQAPTTTVVVMQMPPVTAGPAPTSIVAGDQALPATGNGAGSTELAVIALTLIGVGVVMLRLAPKPTR